MLTKNKSYFLDFPENSRLWIFMAERNLEVKEITFTKQALQLFIPQWQAHGNQISANFEIIDNQFIVITVNESITDASGCSIDSMTRYIKKIEEELNISFTNRMLIAFKINNEIKTLPLPQFKELVKKGEISPEAIIYNNSISSLHEFRNQWEIPLNKSWAKNLLP